MVNVQKLKGKMIECGITVGKLADIMGMDRATLYRRLERKGENFTIKEADIIAKTLNLNIEEANAIFFSQFVA